MKVSYKESRSQRMSKTYVVLDDDLFKKYPPAREPKVRERVLHERGSSERVTWNAFRLLTRRNLATWWPHLVSLAKANNENTFLPSGWEEIPKISLWAPRQSPKAYLDTSRARMRTSDNAAWVARSKNPKPVEGPSKIDIVLRNSRLLIYVITNWHYDKKFDISLRTRYDPKRNQIARIIDCLIDQAQADRLTPILWMFVRNVRPDRAYMRLIEEYRSRPESLSRELPHRRSTETDEVARNLTAILWKDIISTVAQVSCSDDHSTRAAKEELLRRI